MKDCGVTANKALVLGVIVIVAVLFLTAGCVTSPPLEEPFTVTHKDGYEVTVIHTENRPLVIEKECGQYGSYYIGDRKVTTRVRGCASPPKSWLTTCEVKSPNPKDDFNETWKHEIDHCKGMAHPPARGKMQ